MSNILPTGNRQTMSSREVAELCGKKHRHDSVKRTIERLVQQEVIAQPPMVEMQEYKSLISSGNHPVSVVFYARISTGIKIKHHQYDRQCEEYNTCTQEITPPDLILVLSCWSPY